MTKENKHKHSNASTRSELSDTTIQEMHEALLKDKESPAEGFSLLPIILIFLFAGVCFWGGIYIVNHGGDFRWDAYDPDYVYHDAVASIPEKSLFEIGQKVFTNQCAQCHQADGQGVIGVYPPLVASKWVTGHQEVLARILINGMNGKVLVLGKTYNGNMPAFGPSGLNLKAKQIAGVLTYIRQEWGNAASEVTEATMLDYMAEYSTRSTPWTAEELLANLSPEPIAPVEDVDGAGELSPESKNKLDKDSESNHTHDAHTDLPSSDDSHS